MFGYTFVIHLKPMVSYQPKKAQPIDGRRIGMSFSRSKRL